MVFPLFCFGGFQGIFGPEVVRAQLVRGDVQGAKKEDEQKQREADEAKKERDKRERWGVWG